MVELKKLQAAILADLPQLLGLKDACIARMRAEGIEQWDEVLRII